MPGPLPASRLALVLAGSLAGALAAWAPARAADLDAAPLRGTYAETPAATTWEGFYFGAHYGYAQADYDPKGASKTVISQALYGTALATGAVQNLNLLQRKSTSSDAPGGFVGYNFQVDEVVVGIEADYSRVGIKAGGSGTKGLLETIGNVSYNYSATVSAYAKATDVGSVRLRAGYAMGSFLPYLTIGLAGARTGINQNGVVSGTYTDLSIPPRFAPNTRFTDLTYGNTLHSKFALGAALGAGVEWALTPNVLVRGEVIHSAFGSVGGGKLALTQARVGAGLKF